MDSCRLISPSSDKLFWSAPRNRVDTLIENQKPTNRSNRLKEDSMLPMRGFDSVSCSLSQLSANLESALQGARDLARPPILSDLVHSTLENTKIKQKRSIDEQIGEEDEDETRENNNRGSDSQECAEDEEENGPSTKRTREVQESQKCKFHIAISMAKKAGYLARELQSLKSDLCFMQERCILLEEENCMFRDGLAKGIRSEEDDLMRLQMEALLAAKSRLGNENASLTRENRCLNQLVEYHQLTSEEVSESYQGSIMGILDFSSPPTTIPEEESEDTDGDTDEDTVTLPVLARIYMDSQALWMIESEWKINGT